jgi:hypothetical protein
MRFIETDNGFVNCEHVAEIKVWRKTGDRIDRFSLRGIDGRPLGEAAYAVKPGHISPIVSAPAGWTAVHLAIDDEGSSLWDEPILAFAVEQIGLSPIGLDGLIEPSTSSFHYMGLRRPDGKVVAGPDSVEFYSVEQFKETYERVYQEANAVKAIMK